MFLNEDTFSAGVAAVKQDVGDFVDKYGRATLTIGLVVGALVVPELSFAADENAAPTTATTKTDVDAIISAGKYIAGGAISMLVALFAVKLWKRVFGGA